MNTSAALQHTVEAFNLATASENKIHDDTVAKKFGFEGGLVPGVEVYAYMIHLPVARFGMDWLAHGTAACRFHKPVYDGRNASVSGTVQDDESIALKVEMDGILCATGQAALGDALAAPPANDIPSAPLPEHATRPDAAPENLVEGQNLGTYEVTHSAKENADYVRGVRESLGLYTEQGIIHPGLILRLGNRALSMNVRLGPWIHVGSEIRNYDIARVGDRLAAPARVIKEYDHKGHRFVELDVLITANGAKSLARIHHTAIYRPRQVTGV
jgi:hypothetical protein